MKDTIIKLVEEIVEANTNATMLSTMVAEGQVSTKRYDAAIGAYNEAFVRLVHELNKRENADIALKMEVSRLNNALKEL